MEDCSPKTPRVGLMWRGTGEHKRPGTQEVNKRLNWFQVLNCDDVGKAWSTFHGHFAGVIDKVAPVKKIRLKQRSEPWITHEILELIKERDKVLLEFKRSNQKSSYEQFCKIRNLIQNEVKKAKNSLYNDKVEECKGSSSQLWKTLKSIGLSKGTPGSSKISLSEGEEIIFENI